MPSNTTTDHDLAVRIYGYLDSLDMRAGPLEDLPTNGAFTLDRYRQAFQLLVDAGLGGMRNGRAFLWVHADLETFDPTPVVENPPAEEPRPEAGPVAPKTTRAKWDEGMPDRNGGGATSDAKQHEAWLWRDDVLKSKPMARFIALEMHNVMTYELHRQKRSGEFGTPMPIANRMLEQRTGLSKQAVEHAVAWAVALGAFRRIDDRLGCKPGRGQGKGAAAIYMPTVLNHR